MIRIMNYSIDKTHDGQTVEHFLKSLGYSRHLLIHLKQTEDGLTVDNNKVYTTYRLNTHENLKVILKDEAASENIVPVKMPLNIVFEDEDLLIINKASGVPIHPSQGNFDCTLANGVAYYFEQKGERFVYRSINRLDRDTTGLLILAKNMLSGCLLSNQMKAREIKREYLAVAEGLVPDEGVIDAPIARVDGSTIERQIDFENGDLAITHFKRLCSKNGFSLVSLRLDTGRTHQIRVHMKHIGHPLPGDFLYNPNFEKINRQALHSHKLSFIHPITHEKLEFTAPLPDDMAELIN